VKKKARQFWKFLENTQKLIMVLSCVFIVIAICGIVTMRYIFEIDLYGIEEIIMMVSFWLYFLGSSMGSCEKSQISADILSTYIKNDKAKRLMGLVTATITTGICMLVTVWAFNFIQWSMKMNPKTPVFRFPVLIPQSAILAGFCLMSFYHLFHLVNDARIHVKLSRASDQ
jgi:TRAP-type C4-dicarboxylate transport system permease small subunit